jgi:RNA-directed DNA polymerase
MKRIGNIYERICDIDNIKAAISKSSLGKRNTLYVRRVMAKLDYYAVEIQKMLIEKTYVPSSYITKIIHDGPSQKERTIYKPRYYPDQIIHWALMLQLHEIIMHGMYEYTCGSVPGRGTSYGQKALRKWLDSDYRGTKYCLKMDISKFYPSVDAVILKQMFRKRIKDINCLWLIDKIIDSNEHGLPIGNYTSQWFSNFFLQNMDHYIKENLKVKYYLRYVDDLVILGGNKKELHRIRRLIDEYLSSINLKMKGDWQVFLITTRAIDFLVFRFFRDKTILRKCNALRIRRRITKISKKENLNYSDACAVISYWGWIKRSNSYNFYNKYVKSKVSLGKAKRTVSYYAKLRNNS